MSGVAALVLLLPMEAGVPIPLPADLVMFTVGERVAAGQFPLWLAEVAAADPVGSGPGDQPTALVS
jgi:membrane protein DedA with SNARE-associated domain